MGEPGQRFKLATFLFTLLTVNNQNGGALRTLRRLVGQRGHVHQRGILEGLVVLWGEEGGPVRPEGQGEPLSGAGEAPARAWTSGDPAPDVPLSNLARPPCPHFRGLLHRARRPCAGPSPVLLAPEGRRDPHLLHQLLHAPLEAAAAVPELPQQRVVPETLALHGARRRALRRRPGSAPPFPARRSNGGSRPACPPLGFPLGWRQEAGRRLGLSNRFSRFPCRSRRASGPASPGGREEAPPVAPAN